MMSWEVAIARRQRCILEKLLRGWSGLRAFGTLENPLYSTGAFFDFPNPRPARQSPHPPTHPPTLTGLRAPWMARMSASKKILFDSQGCCATAFTMKLWAHRVLLYHVSTVLMGIGIRGVKGQAKQAKIKRSKLCFSSAQLERCPKCRIRSKERFCGCSQGKLQHLTLPLPEECKTVQMLIAPPLL